MGRLQVRLHKGAHWRALQGTHKGVCCYLSLRVYLRFPFSTLSGHYLVPLKTHDFKGFRPDLNLIFNWILAGLCGIWLLIAWPLSGVIRANRKFEWFGRIGLMRYKNWGMVIGLLGARGTWDVGDIGDVGDVAFEMGVFFFVQEVQQAMCTTGTLCSRGLLEQASGPKPNMNNSTWAGAKVSAIFCMSCLKCRGPVWEHPGSVLHMCAAAFHC